ncbi:hypothetical protein M7I_5022 [Glarea lozoyensis 74030]|uniref:Uncharacterized protein n=1 Tax=Glarea lozoyensis (strain ATCC 74030 / MF5533) TaxID=1104152 RepID=H0EQR7_GLAL7|nr:hypothetical protein M7I_5022 [Glarea lozoyensis 74030]
MKNCSILTIAASVLVGGVRAAPELARKAIHYTRSSDLRSSYDYIIAGGGTAGLTVADRLTESGRFVEYGYFSDIPSSVLDPLNPIDASPDSLMYNITSVGTVKQFSCTFFPPEPQLAADFEIKYDIESAWGGTGPVLASYGHYQYPLTIQTPVLPDRQSLVNNKTFAEWALKLWQTNMTGPYSIRGGGGALAQLGLPVIAPDHDLRTRLGFKWDSVEIHLEVQIKEQ